MVNKQDPEALPGGYCFDASLSVFGIPNASGESLEFPNIIGDISVGGPFLMFVTVQEQTSVGENCHS